MDNFGSIWFATLYSFNRREWFNQVHPPRERGNNTGHPGAGFKVFWAASIGIVVFGGICAVWGSEGVSQELLCRVGEGGLKRV